MHKILTCLLFVLAPVLGAQTGDSGGSGSMGRADAADVKKADAPPEAPEHIPLEAQPETKVSDPKTDNVTANQALPADWLKPAEEDGNAAGGAQGAPSGGLESVDPGDTLVRFAIGAAIFIVVCVGIVWFIRRNPGTRKYFGSGPIKVISRSYIGPRSMVLLLKIGDRVLVVGHGPEGMHTLSEITDPTEVTRLLDAVEEGNPVGLGNTFRDALRATESGSAKERFTKKLGERLARSSSTSRAEVPPAAPEIPVAKGTRLDISEASPVSMSPMSAAPMSSAAADERSSDASLTSQMKLAAIRRQLEDAKAKLK